VTKYKMHVGKGKTIYRGYLGDGSLRLALIIVCILALLGVVMMCQFFSLMMLG